MKIVLSRLRLPYDILFHPARAIQRIMETREWVAAYAIVVALNILATLLIAPALLHVAGVTYASDPTIKAHTGTDAATLAKETITYEIVFQIFWPLFAWFLATMSLWLVSLEAPQRVAATFFSLNANAWVPTAIGSLLLAIVVRMHDPSTFKSFSDLLVAFPDSLASLRPHASDRELEFLGFWDIFRVWSLILIGYGFSAITKIGLTASLFISFSVGLLTAFFLTTTN